MPPATREGRDTPKVEPEELENYLKALPAWRLNAERTVLTRRFTAKNFVAGAATPCVPRAFFGGGGARNGSAAAGEGAKGAYLTIFVHAYKPVPVEPWKAGALLHSGLAGSPVGHCFGSGQQQRTSASVPPSQQRTKASFARNPPCPSSAIKFFNKVADVAEAEGHHPDLHLTYFREVRGGRHTAQSCEPGCCRTVDHACLPANANCLLACLDA